MEILFKGTILSSYRSEGSTRAEGRATSKLGQFPQQASILSKGVLTEASWLKDVQLRQKIGIFRPCTCLKDITMLQNHHNIVNTP
jgi:hypothetical protein